MKKRLLTYLLLCGLILTLTAPAAYATETTGGTETTAATEALTETTAETTVPTEAPADATEETRPANACGENLTWSMEGTTLTISGSGAMDSFYAGAPWADYKNSIETVVLTGGVTTVGAAAFTDYDKLTSVDFGSSLREIDTAAFKNCDGLTSISLPSTFRRFGEESFYGCSNLKEIHCSGGMPSFNMNCLWASYLTIYFPTNNPWPVVHIEQLETAFQGRIEFLAADGSDPYVPTEPTKETQPETKPAETTQPTTEPEVTQPPTTVPPTVPTTEATVPEIKETEPAAEAVTEATEETEETTEATEPEETLEEETVSGGLFGLIMICVVLTAGVVGALVFRWKRSGKYGA